MIRVLLALSAALAVTSISDADDTHDFVMAMGELQPSLEDLRCEYEGAKHFLSPAIVKERHLKPDGLFESFSGIYVWTSSGDVSCKALRRYAEDGRILREQYVVRSAAAEAEHYLRPNDSPLGNGAVADAASFATDEGGMLGTIHLTDTIRRMSRGGAFDLSLADDRLEGRKIKILTFTMKGLTTPFQRFWIDPDRGGQVIRREGYDPNGAVLGRTVIDLKDFVIQGGKVWIPIAGTTEGFAAIENGKPVTAKSPTYVETIAILRPTLQFNQHPPSAVFQIAYKLGTPITDNLRKLEFEFGQQHIGQRPARAEAQVMLAGLLSKAEEQKKELVAASPSRVFDWSMVLPWVAALAVLASGLALWRNRRYS